MSMQYVLTTPEFLITNPNLTFFIGYVSEHILVVVCG